MENLRLITPCKKIIEKTNGILENTIETIDDNGKKHMTKRYWINL